MQQGSGLSPNPDRVGSARASWRTCAKDYSLGANRADARDTIEGLDRDYRRLIQNDAFAADEYHRVHGLQVDRHVFEAREKKRVGTRTLLTGFGVWQIQQDTTHGADGSYPGFEASQIV